MLNERGIICTVFRNFRHIVMFTTYMVFVILDITVTEMKVLDINGQGKSFSTLLNYKIFNY